MVSINLLGTIEVHHDGRAVALPPSRKTRALLGYLALTRSPQRRDRLCELFWDVPDDPRGALRWSLSKLRSIINTDDMICLNADRERIWLEFDCLKTDVDDMRRMSASDAATLDELAAAWEKARDPVLADCELSAAESYSLWLAGEREKMRVLRMQIAVRILGQPDIAADKKVIWSDRWLEDAPFEAAAAIASVSSRREAGLKTEADAREAALSHEFRAADLPIPDFPATAHAFSAQSPALGKDPVQTVPYLEQRVKFVQAPDGTNLAWAAVGDPSHPPLVKAANWLTHLELDWEAPIWSPLFRDLASDHRLVRYDERGCGISDWDVEDISLESFVNDLMLVLDAAKLDRVPLLGISQGAAVCIEFAARHPERVSHLVLFGGYPAGWRHLATPDEAREREAIMVLTEQGWGRSDPSYRHLFSRTFMPDATPTELEWFDEFQRRTTSAENAVRFLRAFAELDVRHRLNDLRAPTLVMHSRGDRRIPIATGRSLAAAIPDAEFVVLDSENHLLIGREAASLQFLSAVRNFIRR